MIELRVCIVGLGLMGGSLAQALRGQVKQLIGVDRHAATRQTVLEDGTVDTVTADMASGIRSADLLILATPVRSILQILQELPQYRADGCLVMDVGSTKEVICDAMAELPASFAAIGGHPMCGKESAGYVSAAGDLFRDQTFILARNGRTTPQIETVALSIVEAIGAVPLFLSAVEHDRLVSVASHLPYLISAMLMQRAKGMEDDRVWPVTASGFRDTSRLAGSDPHMMQDILQTNKSAILIQLAQYREELELVRNLLADEDETKLAEWLSQARQHYIAYRKQKP